MKTSPKTKVGSKSNVVSFVVFVILFFTFSIGAQAQEARVEKVQAPVKQETKDCAENQENTNEPPFVGVKEKEAWHYHPDNFSGNWSFGSIALDKLGRKHNKGNDPEWMDWAGKGDRADFRLEQPLVKKEFEDLKKKKNYKVDKDDETLKKEVRELIAATVPLMKGEVINEIMFQSRHVFPVREWEKMAKEIDPHGLRFFDFRTYKLKTKLGEKEDEKMCLTLTVFRNNHDKDRRVSEEEWVQEYESENPPEKTLTTNHFLVDTTVGNSGIIYLRQKDGKFTHKMHDD